jgi:hypothetical protein
MNDYQNALLKMIDEIIKFFDDNPDLLKNPVLKKHYDELKAQKKDLLANKIVQETDIKGLFTRKKEVKNELAIENFQLTGSLRSFATDNNNDLLYKEIDKSKTDIKRLIDEDVLSYTQLVVSKIIEYQKDLEPYGIKAEDLVNLTAMHDLYHELMLLPAEKRKEVKVATANIKQIIKDILTLLRESIDNDMLQFQDDKPELYKKYAVLREIDDSKTTALSIIGTVHDADSDCDGVEDECLQHVRATVKFKAGHAWKEMHATTSAKGNYQFKGIPDGKCTLTFELEYYDTVVIESVVYSDKATKLDVKMKKKIR